MLLGNMEVTGGGFQAAMPQQDLDGTQIGARLEQMGCKAVAQRMRRDLLGDSSATDGIVKNREDVVVTDGLVRIFSGKEPLLGFVVSPDCRRVSSKTGDNMTSRSFCPLP